MISPVDRYHGPVFRHLLLQHGGALVFEALNVGGRADTFRINKSVIQIKHSTKRLPPWRFTFSNAFDELDQWRRAFGQVWIFLVCGFDGIVSVTVEELCEIAVPDRAGAFWVKIKRERRSMYRVAGRGGALPRAKARGFETFLAAVAGPETS